MKRRDLFKAIGTLVAGAVCAPLAKALSNPQIDWGEVARENGSGHVSSSKRVDVVEFWPKKAYDQTLYTAGNDALDSLRYGMIPRFRRYEGIASRNDGLWKMWRFDAAGDDYTSPAALFRCANCEHTVAFDRNAMREHGKACAKPIEEYD